MTHSQQPSIDILEKLVYHYTAEYKKYERLVSLNKREAISIALGKIRVFPQEPSILRITEDANQEPIIGEGGNRTLCKI